MNISIAIFGSICLLFSCNIPDAGDNKTEAITNNNRNITTGTGYLILKRFRVLDKQGFNQPLEAASFVLPANWQINGSVAWNGNQKCIPEIVQASLHAQSADGGYELMMFPTTQFDWSDDPVYLDAMKRGFNLHSCHIAPPQNAAGYITNMMAQELNARVKSAGVISALQQKMDEGASQMTNAARQGGNNAYNHRGSAAEGVLQFADGREGLVFCTLMQTIVSMPGTQGNMSATSQCYVSMRILLKYKPGNEAIARKISSTFFSSARVNPAWAREVQNTLANIGRQAQIEIGRVIAIAHDAQQEMGNNIIRNWEAKTDSRSQGSTGAFGQYLRGVDSWIDENGNTIELNSGYSNAWSRGDGSYLLSNDAGYDPNISLGDKQGWSRMKQ